MTEEGSFSVSSPWVGKGSLPFFSLSSSAVLWIDVPLEEYVIGEGRWVSLSQPPVSQLLWVKACGNLGHVDLVVFVQRLE